MPEPATLPGFLAEGVSARQLITVHAAILFCLFLHGTLLARLLLSRPSVQETLRSWPALVVTGFLLSISINSLLATVLPLLGLGFRPVFAILLGLDLLLVLLLVRVFRSGKASGIPLSRQELLLLLLVAVFAVIMLRNGGLIDRMADSWYHMVLANRIAWNESPFFDGHFLSGDAYEAGLTSYKFRLLWHLNLALITTTGRFPLPLVWHALAPWMTGLSLLGYYLFTLSLVRSRNTALLATALFSFVLGGLNSYFRVSPWPGNASYVIMYLMFFFAFSLLDVFGTETARERECSAGTPPLHRIVLEAVRRNLLPATLLVLTIAIDIGVHLSELFWVALAFWFHAVVLSGLDRGAASPISENPRLAAERRLLFPYALLFGLLLALLALYSEPALYGAVMTAALPVALVLLNGWRSGKTRLEAAPFLRLAGFLLLALSVTHLVDFRHLAGLFFPSGTTIPASPHLPWKIESAAGRDLLLPKWEHQLRPALLYGGLAGILCSIYLFLAEKTRASVFLFATSLFSFVILVSPAAFTILAGLSSSVTAYRVHLLIFHPVAIALALSTLASRLKPERAWRSRAK